MQNLFNFAFFIYFKNNELKCKYKVINKKERLKMVIEFPILP